MANQTDRLTIYLENGKIVNVVSEDPNRVINDVTAADCEAIVKNGYQVMVQPVVTLPRRVLLFVIAEGIQVYLFLIRAIKFSRPILW